MNADLFGSFVEALMYPVLISSLKFVVVILRNVIYQVHDEFV